MSNSVGSFCLRQHGTVSLLCIVFCPGRGKKRHTSDEICLASESPIGVRFFALRAKNRIHRMGSTMLPQAHCANCMKYQASSNRNSPCHLVILSFGCVAESNP